MTPMELIVAATRTNAEGYGKLHEIGTIEAGKLADIVLLNKTPLEDIGASCPQVLEGRMFYRAAYANPHPEKQVKGIRCVPDAGIEIEARYEMA